jgi:3-hydroxyisobutyrate dehydrogenase
MNNFGFIGLGKMGIPMVLNLLKSGFLISVYNRDLSKANSLLNQGAKVYRSPLELMDSCDVVFLMVSDDDAIEELFCGREGLLATTTRGKIVVNMSTVSPQISKRMAAYLAEKGNYYLDAPVSGSLKQAQDASLVIMVGGEITIFEKIKPLFDCLGKLAMYLGETGAGNSAKLAINTLLSFHAQGLAEAVAFAKNQGINTADFLNLVNHSALGNPFMKIKGEAILQGNYSAVFALKHIVKDLNLAKHEGLNMPLSNTAIESFNKAQETLGEEDIIAIIKQMS